MKKLDYTGTSKAGSDGKIHIDVGRCLVVGGQRRYRWSCILVVDVLDHDALVPIRNATTR